ncbi:MAG TPA: 2-oxoacid:acceptor oxidoreductase family protein [Chloroflexota bacterium]|nr:2-oxoacid:acceptor oxidoreductase family protein [Chloroflexota bacterium]
MFQVRIHGRGGQGVVTAAELLSVAAFLEGKHAQAFPSFGSERMGAPVVAFCRIDQREIRSREPVDTPDAVVIQDPTLLHSVDVFAGLSPAGYLLINSSRSIETLGIDEYASVFPADHVRIVAATDLALAHVGRPIPNAALLGGFAALTGWIGLDAVVAAIRARFAGSVGTNNVAAAVAAYDVVSAARPREAASC